MTDIEKFLQFMNLKATYYPEITMTMDAWLLKIELPIIVQSAAAIDPNDVALAKTMSSLAAIHPSDIIYLISLTDKKEIILKYKDTGIWEISGCGKSWINGFKWGDMTTPCQISALAKEIEVIISRSGYPDRSIPSEQIIKLISELVKSNS
jgi:hypothetical protein